MRPRYSFSSRRTRRTENIRKQKKKYPSIANEIIENSDIILEVLDARFPDETRNLELEKEIKKQKKELIFVSNKSDISNKKINKSKYPFPIISVSCNERKGIRELRNLIKRISKKIKKEDKISVGIIGYPNTGKSSLINILIGKSSAGVGSEAGFTKGIQKIKLSENILLLDSPGVIPKEEYSSTNKEKISKHTKVGGRSYSQVKNPDIAVHDLMKEYSKEIEEFYKINSKGDAEILIEELGKQKGFLKKGGIVDEDKTSRLILKDWQKGNIRV
jgi:ribosome biogenesis GTPase A